MSRIWSKNYVYIKTVLKLMTQNKSGLNSQHILKMESRYYAIGTAAFLLLKLNSSGIDLFCPQDEGRSRLMIVISDKELSAPRLPMSRCLPSAHVIWLNKQDWKCSNVAPVDHAAPFQLPGRLLVTKITKCPLFKKKVPCYIYTRLQKFNYPISKALQWIAW